MKIHFIHAIYLFFVVCDEKDIVCKRDNISLEAVYEIHHLIDDDQNGNVDQSESDEVSVQSYQTRSVNLTLMLNTCKLADTKQKIQCCLFKNLITGNMGKFRHKLCI